MPASGAASPQPLEPEKLTWAALLGRWVDFARTAVVLPNNTAGARLRASVPDIIMLQAVWFSLGQLEGLDLSERAVGLDRAAVLIEKHGAALRRRWDGEPLPTQIDDVVRDAARRLEAARSMLAAMTARPTP